MKNANGMFIEGKEMQKDLQFRKLFDGTPCDDATFGLMNRGAGLARAGDFFEIEAGHYDHFLGCMPPLDFEAGGFSLAEFTTGYLTHSFFHRGGRFWCLIIERRSAADFAAWARAFSPCDFSSGLQASA